MSFGVLKFFGLDGGAMSWGARRTLYQQLASQIDNGRPLLDAMDDYRARAVRRNRKSLAKSMQGAVERVRDGKTFVQALGGSLSPLEKSVLSSGETAGQLPGSMRLVLDVRARVARIQRKVLSYFTAPIIYLVTLLASLYVIGSNVVPPLSQVVPTSRWTGWAYGMYLMGAIATGYGLFITLGVIVVLLGVIVWTLPRWSGRGRAFCDAYVFPYNVYRDVQGFAWLLSFTALLRAGVADTKALQDQIASASPWMASRLKPILTGLIDGMNLAEAMRRSKQDFPSRDLIDEIAAYMNFDDFGEKIDQVAKDYSDVLERKLMVVGGVIGAVFSGAMFMAFGVITLGANTISTLIQSGVAH